MKEYEKPAIVTIEIPEQRANACNVTGGEGCSGTEQIVTGGICGPQFTIVSGCS